MQAVVKERLVSSAWRRKYVFKRALCTRGVNCNKNATFLKCAKCKNVWRFNVENQPM
jgi:hypothetical protein